MEFLKEYWPLLVCIVLIIVAVVLLIVFRDKNEQTQVETKQENKVETKDEKTTKTKTEASKKEKGEMLEEPAKEDDKKEPVKEEKAEEKVEEKINKKEKPEELVETESNEMETKKETSQKYMVTYDKEAKQWVVKKTGATRASKRCKTKKEAMEVAEKLAESQDLNLTVKKKDGKFQKRENASK